MSIPYRFDDSNTERSNADALLDSLGVTQASLAASQKAGKGDASKGLTGIGDAGSPSQNPMAIGPVPAPPHVEPNPPAPATAPVPPGNSNPMKVGAAPNYIQPGTQNPKANATGVVSAKNPMGL